MKDKIIAIVMLSIIFIMGIFLLIVGLVFSRDTARAIFAFFGNLLVLGSLMFGIALIQIIKEDSR